MNASGIALKAVRLELPLDLHRELRIEAAKQGVSMASFVRVLVENYLSSRETGGIDERAKLIKKETK